jgi:hypothetical protein
MNNLTNCAETMIDLRFQKEPVIRDVSAHIAMLFSPKKEWLEICLLCSYT